jgi:predicted DNA-binding protein
LPVMPVPVHRKPLAKLPALHRPNVPVQVGGDRLPGVQTVSSPFGRGAPRSIGRFFHSLDTFADAALRMTSSIATVAGSILKLAKAFMSDYTFAMGTTTITHRIDEELKARLDRYCEEHGLKAQAVVREAIAEWLEDAEDIELIEERRKGPWLDWEEVRDTV